MIDVLVHQLAPLLAAQFAEEGVSLVRSRRGTSLDEAIDEIEKFLSFGREVTLVRNHE